MIPSKPPLTNTTHTLPFDKLSPRDFERLCLWLVEREGYEQAEHLGAAGSEQGRDIIARCDGKLWAFQCKRVRRFGPKAALEELNKIRGLRGARRPVGLVFIVTCDVSAATRAAVRKECERNNLKCVFWTGTELDQRVKQHVEIVTEFFGYLTGRSDQELQATAQHDVDIFKRSDSILSERFLMAYLGRLRSTDSCTRKDLEIIDNYLRFFGEVGNSYLLKELSVASTAFLQELISLVQYGGRHFFVYPKHMRTIDDCQYCLHPELNIDREGSGERDEMERYDQLQQQLHELCQVVALSYREYRSTVKVQLLH